METDINQLLKQGVTIQLVPVSAILPEFEKLHEKIRKLAADVENLQNELEVRKKPDNKMSVQITTSEIVGEYKISRTTLWRWRNENKVKPVGRIGKGGLLYKRADIEKYLETNLEL